MRWKKRYIKKNEGFVVDEDATKFFHTMLVEKIMADYDITDKVAANALLASVFLTMAELIHLYGFVSAKGLGTFVAVTTKKARVKLIDGSEVELPLVKRVKFKCSKVLHKMLNDEAKETIAQIVKRRNNVNEKFDFKKIAKHVRANYARVNGLDQIRDE